MRLASRLAGGLLAATLMLATASGGAADGTMVRVDIYRAGSNGLMNSIPCIITITGEAKGTVCHAVIRGAENKGLSGGKATVLLGGDRVICELNPSNGIQVFTPRALRPEGFMPEARSWAPTTLAPRARAGQTIEVGIVPKSRGSAYVGGWLVRQEPHTKTAKHDGR